MQNHLIAVVLLLFAAGSFPAPAEKGPSVGKVEFIRGSLERNRSGELNWTFADTVRQLRDSDRLRTVKNSCAIIDLCGGLKLYLAGNSMVRLESRSQGRKKISLNTITLYFGSVYLQTGEDSDSLFEHNIITPAASVSARSGAGFAVSADREAGTSQVLVLDGTVTAKNIPLDKSLFLQAGKIMTIELGRDFEPPRPADTLDIKTLAWLSALDTGFVAREQDKSRVKHEQIRAILSDGVEDRIIITRFKNHSDYSGLWDIEKALSVMAADLLKRNAGLPVEITGSFPTEKVMDSLKSKATIAVIGSISAFDLSKESKLGASKDDPFSFLSCRLEIDFTLLNPRDGRTLTRFSAAETIKEKESPGNSFKEIVDRPFSLNDKIFFESILGRTVQSVLNTMNSQMKDYLRL